MSLTEEQLAAVNSEHKHAVVIAGAGSGKTTTLVARILSLINQGADPKSIMVITFTRAAARELRKRLGGYGSLVMVGTFHSVILRAMRENGIRVNVIDEESADALLDECGISLGLATRTDSKVKWKKSRAHHRREIEAVRGQRGSAASPITDVYLSKMQCNGDIDYPGLLHAGLQMALQDDGPFSHITHLIVDEAQDNEPIQWRFVGAIGKNASVMAVGDPAQSIYEWRGATPEAFINLPWHRHELTETFRCPQDVVGLSNKTPTGGVKLVSKKTDGGYDVYKNLDVTTLLSMLKVSYDPEEIAVLCRYNEDVENYRNVCHAAGWPIARTIQPERDAVYWTLRYLCCTGSPTARAKAARAIAPWKRHLSDKLTEWITSDLPTPAVKNLADHWLAGCGVNYGPAEILQRIEWPYTLQHEAQYYHDRYVDSTLDMFYAEETAEQHDEVSAGISVVNIHQAKGREWPVVIMPDLSEGKWPKREPKPEDHRLFHVAITRCMHRLFLLYNDTPSVFLLNCGAISNGTESQRTSGAAS